MGMLAWLFGFIGGLCMLMGIVTAVGIISPLGEQYTVMFWFVLSALLLLMSIAFAIGSGKKEF